MSRVGSFFPPRFDLFFLVPNAVFRFRFAFSGTSVRVCVFVCTCLRVCVHCLSNSFLTSEFSLSSSSLFHFLCDPNQPRGAPFFLFLLLCAQYAHGVAEGRRCTDSAEGRGFLQFRDASHMRCVPFDDFPFLLPSLSCFFSLVCFSMLFFGPYLSPPSSPPKSTTIFSVVLRCAVCARTCFRLRFYSSFGLLLRTIFPARLSSPPSVDSRNAYTHGKRPAVYAGFLPSFFLWCSAIPYFWPVRLFLFWCVCLASSALVTVTLASLALFVSSLLRCRHSFTLHAAGKAEKQQQQTEEAHTRARGGEGVGTGPVDSHVLRMRS